MKRVDSKPLALVTVAVLALTLTAAAALGLPAKKAASGNPTAGKTVFMANCAVCHMLKAAGAVGTIGPNLDDVKLPQATLVKAVNDGGATVMTTAAAAKYSTQMVAYKGALTTTQIDDVAAFVYGATHPSTSPAPKQVVEHITVTIGSPKVASCTLSRTLVPKATVIFTILNRGKASRVFEIDGKKTPRIAPHKSARLTVNLSKAGHYTYSCTVKGVLRVS